MGKGSGALPALHHPINPVCKSCLELPLPPLDQRAPQARLGDPVCRTLLARITLILEEKWCSNVKLQLLYTQISSEHIPYMRQLKLFFFNKKSC